MEESQYLMWMKRKQILKSHLQAPFEACNNSWEERAFAEDAARILDGCIWPPRSYCCSFCKREFRSAQALGGHMNIHRRDRARLKQSLSPLRSEGLHHHNNDCCVNPAGTITTSSLSPSMLSAKSKRENCGQHTISPYASSVSWGQHRGSSNSEPEEIIKGKEEDLKGFCHNNYVETDLSMGLSPMLGQTLQTGSYGDEAISCKRSKTSISSLPFFLKPCSNDRQLVFQSAEIVLGLKPGMEDLDLELRLGKSQKVK